MKGMSFINGRESEVLRLEHRLIITVFKTTQSFKNSSTPSYFSGYWCCTATISDWLDEIILLIAIRSSSFNFISKVKEFSKKYFAGLLYSQRRCYRKCYRNFWETYKQNYFFKGSLQNYTVRYGKQDIAVWTKVRKPI